MKLAWERLEPGWHAARRGSFDCSLVFEKDRQWHGYIQRHDYPGDFKRTTLADARAEAERLADLHFAPTSVTTPSP